MRNAQAVFYADGCGYSSERPIERAGPFRSEVRPRSVRDPSGSTPPCLSLYRSCCGSFQEKDERARLVALHNAVRGVAKHVFTISMYRTGPLPLTSLRCYVSCLGEGLVSLRSLLRHPWVEGTCPTAVTTRPWAPPAPNQSLWECGAEQNLSRIKVPPVRRACRLKSCCVGRQRRQ